MNIIIDFTALTTKQQITIIDIVKDYPFKLSQIANEITDDKDPIRFKEAIYYICSLPNINSNTISPFWFCIPKLHNDQKFIQILLTNPNTPGIIKEKISRINLEDIQ